MNKFTDFYSHVVGNEDVRKRLEKVCGKFGPDSGLDPMLEAVIEFAKGEGFSFTMEEAKEYFDSISGSHELLEEELEAVAGGKTNYGGCVIVGIDDRGGVCIAYGNISGEGGCVGVGYYGS